MATAAQAVIAANTFTCTFPTPSTFFSKKLQKVNHLSPRASYPEDPDCNAEECAPDKEDVQEFKMLYFKSTTFATFATFVTHLIATLSLALWNTGNLNFEE